MAYPLLRRGSRNTYVADVQAELNLRVTPKPNLAVDGIFGQLTDAAVKRFQAANRPLGVDGVVGPKTHAVLFPEGKPQPVFHNVPFLSQPTSDTCWAASTAMMTNKSIADVIRRTRAAGFDIEGGIDNVSSTDQAVVDGNRYGMLHGLVCHAPMSWTAAAMRDALRRSPLMFDMLWNEADYVANLGSPGHMVVIAGTRGMGVDMELSVYDPWPPRRGRRYVVNYYQWMREVPTRTYRVFEWSGY